LATGLKIRHWPSESRTTNSPNIQLRIRETGGAPQGGISVSRTGFSISEAAAETPLYFQEIGEALAQADLHLHGQFPKRLAQYLYPPADFSQEQKKLAAEGYSNRVASLRLAR
jgi:hypothetical protein